jgi:AraC-like DNA-binding protein
VDVVALLPPPLLSHLRIVLAHGHSVAEATDWPAAEAMLRRRSVDALVVDPRPEPGASVMWLTRLRERHPAVPMVVYTVLTPGTLRAMVELARHGVEHVVLHRFDDDPRRFLSLLEQLPGYALSERLLAQIAAPLGRLPSATARAVERMVRLPHRFTGVEDLAAASGVTVRQLYRQLETAGIGSPRWLVQGARVLRAFAYLQDRGCSLGDAARKLGYSQPRVLSRQMLEVVGRTPAEARRSLAAEMVVELLSEKLRRA